MRSSIRNSFFAGTVVPAIFAPATVVIASLTLGACGSSDASKPKPTPVVGVMIAKTEPVELTAELSGRTEASEIAEVRPQVAGIVMQRLFQEGSFVRAGQPLYQIDSRLYAASQAQASASLAAAQATVEANRLKAERFEALALQGGVSKQDAADARAAYNQSRAAVGQARAALASAQVNLGFTRVSSPISGRIGISMVTKGALVTNAQTTPMAKVQRLDPMYVNIKQSGADFIALRRAIESGKLVSGAAPVTVVLPDGSTYPVAGKLNPADIDVDPETGTITVRAVVPNPRGELLPGLFVRARVSQGTVPNGILIPQAAVSRDPRGRASVLVANAKDELEKREIVADSPVGQNWLVTSGLKPGERVVVEGLINAREGQKAKVVPAGSKPKPETASQSGGN
ncbi:efflux RND transporter periplasmic adaptor subunit [Novosphingobium taihuense]|uniref:Membrane fusion protein (Multidrug efflux system) n=1 Tax=Novosphingobium taihuense TaxID=260085 RepID=A0A7W7A821_9SPHN|nr:efflux RND transporter periplasmic adaptor subunit [Novosphingobium taihuense]MBB4612144.1 membrane fusion protein (multidrug efflux system) [Novosphingobium taihuense]TWH88502.1 membrane fusion protein (multidrug efflux system) [Novosphingobium taihuense]